MSVYDKDLITNRNKIETAIERIQTYCSEKKTLVAFSGGKDSQCCYHLAKMAGIPFEAQYSITRFEPLELITFIKTYYPNVEFRRAYTKSLIDTITEKGLPNRWRRWCCAAKHKKTEGYDISIIGIRWEESSRRKMRWSMFGVKEDRTAYICPICDWTESDVWEFLNTNKIPHCSLYDEGYKRIGCVCCPLSVKSMEQQSKRWPKVANMLRIASRKRWEYMLSRDGKTNNDKEYNELKQFKNGDEMFDYWIKNGSTFVSEKDENEEPCLFAGTGFSESDGERSE